MKNVFLILAVATLTACSKEKSFHKDFQGAWTYTNGVVNATGDNLGFVNESLTITKERLNGTKFNNSLYEVVSDKSISVNGEIHNVYLNGSNMTINDGVRTMNFQR